MGRQHRLHQAVLILGIIFTAFFYFFFASSEQGLLYANLIFLAWPLAAAIASWLIVSTLGPLSIPGRTVLMFGCGIGLWLLGEILFVYYVIFGLDPFPSIADLFYILGYPLIGIALYRQYRVERASVPHIDSHEKNIAIGFMIAATVIVLYWGTYVPAIKSSDVWTNAFAIFYGIGDLLLLIPATLTALIAHMYRGGKFFISWLYICLGIGFTLVADVLYAQFNEAFDAGLTPAVYIDLLWVLAYASITYGCIRFYLIVRAAQRQAREALESNA